MIKNFFSPRYKKRTEIISIALLIVFSIAFLCNCLPEKNNKITYEWYIDSMNLPTLWERYTGKDVTIAVIDSGLDYDLLGSGFDTSRIVSTYNAFDGTDDVPDFTKHGTAMVNLIGATGDYGMYGVAPSCKFVIVKALNEFGSTDSTTLCNAIQFAVECEVDVINLSLGGKVNDEIADVIYRAYAANIVLMCAAGDYGQDQSIFPASMPECIAVAALNDSGTLYEESNYGESIDVFFPGVNIKTTVLNYQGEVVPVRKNGSSVATAIASGYVALFLEYLQEYTVAEVYDTLRETKGTIRF